MTSLKYTEVMRMNRLKLAYKSFAYSWNLIFESSKFMIFLYFALMLITTSFPLLSAFLLKYVLDALTVATPEIEKVLAVMPDGKTGAPCGACRELMVQLMPDSYKDIEIMMDYKTGRKDFDYCDVFNGVGLQLLLYLLLFRYAEYLCES